MFNCPTVEMAALARLTLYSRLSLSRHETAKNRPPTAGKRSQSSGSPLVLQSAAVPSAISQSSGMLLLLQSAPVDSPISHASGTSLWLQSTVSSKPSQASQVSGTPSSSVSVWHSSGTSFVSQSPLVPCTRSQKSWIPLELQSVGSS